MVLQTITGAYTPACLFTANDPVETVTPPDGRAADRYGRRWNACGIRGYLDYTRVPRQQQAPLRALEAPTTAAKPADP
jgi:hypothetical protein